MSSPDRFATHFETLALNEETLQISHDQTVVPDLFRGAPEKLEVLRTLPRMSTSTSPGTATDLQFLGTLGEGGMGLVRVARQLALNREVAVKTLRHSSDESAPKLLQEAYVTGQLEHPNIIPVYTLGQDDDGAPLIVMKRIEGVSWQEVMHAPELAPDHGTADLVWHLEILMHVCNALRYAHSHKVLHRDIKPENVMIGPFGEVYLLDWGIAMSVAEKPDLANPLPHRSEVIGLSGTPSYLAPEMTDNDAEQQDERTDVYLLGAVLHEILTGSPPHQGISLFAVMRSAFENKPKRYPSSVPAELAATAGRAMASNKDDRFATVDEFRRAISDYLEHRVAFELVEEARALLDEIDVLGESETDEFQLHDRFTECRFAASQALRAWPSGELARSTYVEYLSKHFGDAVRRKDAVQAGVALVELDKMAVDVDPLREQLATLAAGIDSERKEFEGLRELANEQDMSSGSLNRSIAVFISGFLWSAHTFYWAFKRRSGLVDNEAQAYIDGTVVVIAIAIIGIGAGRKTLFSTAANRRFAYLFLIISLTIAAFRFIFSLNPVDITTVRALETVTYGAFAVMGGVLADDLRVSMFGLVYFAVALVDAFYGSGWGWVLGCAHLAFFSGVAWAWTPRQLEKRIQT